MPDEPIRSPRALSCAFLNIASAIVVRSFEDETYVKRLHRDY